MISASLTEQRWTSAQWFAFRNRECALAGVMGESICVVQNCQHKDVRAKETATWNLGTIRSEPCSFAWCVCDSYTLADRFSLLCARFSNKVCATCSQHSSVESSMQLWRWCYLAMSRFLARELKVKILHQSTVSVESFGGNPTEWMLVSGI